MKAPYSSISARVKRTDARLRRYRVSWVPAEAIKPSPENDKLYGPIDGEHDSKLEELVESVRSRGLEEPLILSADNYIVSGHRRLVACKLAGIDPIPCRFTDFKRDGADDWFKVLAEYNPQRIKGVDALIKEAMMQESVEDTAALIDERERAMDERVADLIPMDVDREKLSHAITERRKPFLDAVVKVVEKLQPFWPLSVRQIHYQLLNDPPLTQTPKRSTKDIEAYRYRNDDRSYNAVIRLCRDARYAGHLSMNCIDDPTRPQIKHEGFSCVHQFINNEVENFLLGYQRDRMQSQRQYFEVFGEKNTLRTILDPVCSDYGLTMSLGRGFCSIPVWRDIENRWRSSGKGRMVLFMISDLDPEGLELADDAVRSLRDLHGVPVEGVRVAVTKEQIAIFDLDANSAKETSSRFRSFVERTGSTDTYECEAIPPTALQEALRQAVENVIDLELFEAEEAQEEQDVEEINSFRRKIVEGL